MTLLSFVNELDIGSKVVHANLIIAYKSIGFVFVYICLKRRSDDLIYYDQSIDIIVKKVVMFKNDLCKLFIIKVAHSMKVIYYLKVIKNILTLLLEENVGHYDHSCY